MNLSATHTLVAKGRDVAQPQQGDVATNILYSILPMYVYTRHRFAKKISLHLCCPFRKSPPTHRYCRLSPHPPLSLDIEMLPVYNNTGGRKGRL